jgi:predicted nucleotidyltransferase
MTEITSDKMLGELSDYVYKALQPVAIFVFGSVAKGRSGPESDLDLAIFIKNELTFDQRETIKESALSRWGIELDLIDFNRAPPTLQAEILRNSRKLVVSDDQALATMIMRALRSYQMLNEEREPTLEKRLGAEGWKRLF